MFTGNAFNGIMGRLAPGMCRITANGKIAIKTKNGYKSFNVKTGRLTNCANFVFDMGDEFFFLMPTNNLKVGDIILVNGTPRCVIKVEENEITAFNYENSTKEIDFIGVRREERVYIQVCVDMPVASTRETDNLMEIKDHYHKYVVCRDALAIGNDNGIEIVHAADFLLRENL